MYVSRRPRKEGRGGGRDGGEKKEVKREEGWGRGGAETSRTGKITHFDGIKMSVFPSPYLHGDSAPLESERETEREKSRIFVSPFAPREGSTGRGCVAG